MDRFSEYKDYHNDEQRHEESKEERERKLSLPPVIANEILVDYLEFKGRNGQIYTMTIMKDRRTFSIRYPDTYFMLRDGMFSEASLIQTFGEEAAFYTWVKKMLERYRPAADEV